MTKRQLATACCRVIAILFFGYAISTLYELMYRILEAPPFAVGTGVYVLFGVLLWVFSSKVATWIFPEDGDAGIAISAGTEELFAVVIATYGAMKIVGSIPRFLGSIPDIIERSQAGIPTWTNWMRSGAIAMILGALLIIYARAIGKVLGGRETASQQPTDDDQ